MKQLISIQSLHCTLYRLNPLSFRRSAMTNLVTVGQKLFSQPPIVQVLPLKNIRDACNFHHRSTSTMTDKMREKNPENHIVGFLMNLFANYGGKYVISIWSPTNKQDFWLSQTCNFVFKRLLCPPLVTCIYSTCLNLLSV